MDKPKIGIITYTHGTNFGQRLQNYALQEYLRHIGCDPYTIRQSTPFPLVRRVKIAIKNGVKWITSPALQYKRLIRKKKFRKFNNLYICFYEKIIPFYGNNKKIADQFNAFIVGSDQIWSPQSIYVGDNAFLKFAKSEQKLTYAPSLATDRIPNDKLSYYKNALDDFKYISVREDKGASILKFLVRKEIEVVVDPTLLLDRETWNVVRKPYPKKPREPYILAYFLGSIPEVFLRNVCKKLKVEILIICDDTAMSPAEFVDSIADARAVLTDSFHGTIFSAIYHVPFYNFVRQGLPFSMTSRFDTLYRIMGIKSRMCNFTDFDMSKIDMLDFVAIDKNLKCEIEKSKSFLKKELDFF